MGSESLTRQTRAFDAAVTSLVRLYQFRDREESVGFGLSVSQAWALRALAERGGLSMGALAEELCLSLSATTRAVDPLVERRLLRREPDPDDRRVRRVELLARGRALWARLHDELLAVDRAVLRGLSPREREVVIGAVGRLAEATARWRAATPRA